MAADLDALADGQRLHRRSPTGLANQSDYRQHAATDLIALLAGR